jgi:glycerol uptake facilitator-like aquaporin
MTSKTAPSLSARLTAEGMGTAFLLAVVVGSGIMGERLAGGNTAIALLANALATGAGLAALILTFGGISSHFNPVVTLTEALARQLPWKFVLPAVAVQCAGAFAGVMAAHLMFEEPLFAASAHERSGFAQGFSEFVATFGLVLVIRGVSGTRPGSVAFAVALYIMAAYWFTSSTSFANPAVTLARAFTPTFAGIRPVDVPLFLAAQIAGALFAALVSRLLFGRPAEDSVQRNDLPDP